MPEEPFYRASSWRRGMRSSIGRTVRLKADTTGVSRPEGLHYYLNVG